ncbi:aspartate/tyrosine/aromatic aminotransferase [Candidatus Sumerlaeota bacterium]|nr:aspartate/tyrosine/aromatic aminotransferase [Candidatus Sumerlaeota bacterium]
MFEQIQAAPPDPILGLTAAFVEDSNPDKINLGVGVYQDKNGKTPVLDTVRTAEERLVVAKTTRSYLPIEGSREYGAAVQDLVLGAEHRVVREKRAATAQAPGGTGGLRVAGDFVHKLRPNAKIWMSDPTWANHDNIFKAAGLELVSYPYYNAESKRLRLEGMIAALKKIPEGDVVLLHGCCHNPTGLDPTPDQWREIAQTLKDRGALPLIDFAYQGLSTGIVEDREGTGIVAEVCPEVLIVSSFSKNFGLYGERVGALTLVASSAEARANIFTHIRATIRANYSNPPTHGAAIVATILGDPALRAQWEGEVAEIRDRINNMRTLFVETLQKKGVKRDFSFITSQKGMFSFSGLTEDQVQELRDKHSIYIVGSGRINVAGMTPGNMDRLCEAVASVL